jgi:drug/metabolite transporter (DMT)-like permease
MSLAVGLLSFGPALYVWVNPTLSDLAWLLAIAVVGTFAQIAFAQSLKDADTTAVMPFDFLKLVWASLFGIWIFSEVPDVLTWTGGIVVFASGCYIAWREHVAERRAEQQAKERAALSESPIS